jgi:hypothetical protein
MLVSSDDFLTNRAWHQAVVGGKDLILRRTSALEFLELFSGYLHEHDIDVYAIQPGENGNLNYCLVDSFSGIDYICFGNVLCTSANQTFNDMLNDFDDIDEQSLIEGLSRYYYSHGSSFSSLAISPENAERFNTIKDWAIEYYKGA